MASAPAHSTARVAAQRPAVAPPVLPVVGAANRTTRPSAAIAPRPAPPPHPAMTTASTIEPRPADTNNKTGQPRRDEAPGEVM